MNCTICGVPIGRHKTVKELIAPTNADTPKKFDTHFGCILAKIEAADLAKREADAKLEADTIALIIACAESG